MATTSAALSVAAAAAAAVAVARATPSDTKRLARSSLTASLTPFILFSLISYPLEAFVPALMRARPRATRGAATPRVPKLTGSY